MSRWWRITGGSDPLLDVLTAIVWLLLMVVVAFLVAEALS